MRIAISVLLLASFAWAGSGQKPVPVEKEPRHHLKFENEYTRVFDAIVPGHDVTLYHVHSNDYVFVSLSNLTLRAQVLGHDEVDLPVTVGQTVFTRAPITHRVGNPGDTTFRTIAVEILKNAPSAPPEEDAAPGLSVIADNDRVRIERLVLKSGESTGMHRFPAMGVTVEVSGGKVEVRDDGQAERTVLLKPGDFKWNSAARTCSITNTGKSRFEAVEIEWK